MIRHRASLGSFRPLLLAVLVVSSLPATASAENLVFHNQLKKDSVFVQVSSVFRGMLKRDKAHPVKPGDKTPRIALPGDKIVIISDPFTPNKVLYQGAIPAGRMDLDYDIVLDEDATPPKVTIKLRKSSGKRPRPQP